MTAYRPAIVVCPERYDDEERYMLLIFTYCLRIRPMIYFVCLLEWLVGGDYDKGSRIIIHSMIGINTHTHTPHTYTQCHTHTP